MAEFDKEKLIEIASEKLGLTKEGLSEMLRTGNVQAITSNLSKTDREKVERVMNDPKLAEKFKNQYKG